MQISVTRAADLLVLISIRARFYPQGLVPRRARISTK